MKTLPETEIQALKNKGLTDIKIINDLIKFKENNPKLLKKALPCEMYDKVNLMCRKYMDRMARFEVDYNFLVDETAFKNVAVCAMESAPCLHSKVIMNPITPYWKVADYNINDLVFCREVEDLEKTKKEFFSREIPLNSNVQMNIGLFYHGDKTYILFIWNHMCMDGGGFKTFWSDFCKGYTDYVLKGITPLCFSVGSRKYTEVYRDMEGAKKIKAKLQFANISPRDKHRFPFENDNIENDVIIVSRKIDKEYFGKAVNYAKSVGASVNDLLVASYIDALKKIANFNSNESISVSCATDLRRHIKDKSAIGYTNHVSFSHCAVEMMGDNLKETIEIVKNKTKELKNDEFMGLHGLPLLNIGYKTMIYLQAEPIVKLFYRNPTLSVSNVGAIDTSAFSLAENKPFSAFVAGAAKNKPCAVMTALSINGDLSVSICLRGNDKDSELLEKFFTEYEKNIKSF
ncbi:MAG: hypothetical protein ACI4VW_01135 [Acutalibacteraceae bacterium]